MRFIIASVLHVNCNCYCTFIFYSSIDSGPVFNFINNFLCNVFHMRNILFIYTICGVIRI